MRPVKPAPNLNVLWARCLVDELARCGVRDAVVVAGSRSGPLVFAFHEDERVKLWPHVDERSAGFFALGLAKAARRPVAVVTTSGTATANLHPAVIEAKQGRVPLVVITADRPHDLRDTGANQAVPQVDMYGKSVLWAADLPQPTPSDRALRHVRVTACRAVNVARGPPAGPVHLNVPFQKPLEPTETDEIPAGLEALGRPGGAPFARTEPAPRTLTPDQLDQLAHLVATERGVIVAGPTDDPRMADAVRRAAEALRYPVIADPLSGVRFGAAPGPLIVSAADAILQSPAAAEALAPDVVIRVGAAPVSGPVLRWLEARPGLQVVLDDEWRDPLHVPSERFDVDPALALAALAEHVEGRAQTPWARRWAAAETAAADTLVREAPFTEAAAVRAVVDALPDGALLVIGNSMPVRDLDRYVRPTGKRIRVLGNRGASGIDGVTSTALGAAAANEGPVVLVTGDLSFYHDLPGLLPLRRAGVEATLVVLHNDGGRIFEMLPVSAHDPPFTDLFVAPHGLDFEHAARMFGAAFSRATDADGFGDAFAGALKGGAHVIEARIDPAESRQARAAAKAVVIEAVEKVLGGAGHV